MGIKEIIKHCKRNNQLAYSCLFDTYYQVLYGVSKRILINHSDVEDVLIITFTKIFKNIRDVEYISEQSFIKWMKTIAANESIRFVNSKKQIEFKEDLQDLNLVDHATSNEVDIDIESVYHILSKLPDGYRIVFNLFAIEGYSHKEISQMLNISENTSKSQLRKARIKIIDRIKKVQYEK